MNSCKVVALAGGAGLLVGALSLGWSPTLTTSLSQPSSSGIQIIDEQAVEMSVPLGLSDAEYVAAHEAYFDGDPLPPGFAVTEFGGNVEAFLTGIVKTQTGEKQILVTVVGDTQDLDELRLIFNGVEIASVDRSGGAILDRSNGTSKATLSSFVPDPASVNPYEVLLEWEGFAAQTQSSTLYRR